MTPEQEARLVLDYDVEWTDGLLFGVKKCSSCGRERPKCKPYFGIDNGANDRLKHECNECILKRDRIRRGGRAELSWEFVDGSLCDALLAHLVRRGMSLREVSEASGIPISSLKRTAPTRRADMLRRLLAVADAKKVRR